MKPKETADKLVDEYYSIFAKRLHLSESFDSQYRYNFCKPLAKECALKAVDLLQEQLFLTNGKYWEEVKKHIEKL
jgi:hypothetical protein